LKCRLINLVTLGWLLSCAAVGASWAASYRRPHSLPLYRSDREWRLVANAGTVQLWHTRRLDVTSVSDDGTFTVEEVPIDAAGGVLTPGNGTTWWPIDLPAWGWPPVARCKAMTGGGFRNPDGRVGDFGIAAEVRAVPHRVVGAVLLLSCAVGLLRGAVRSRGRRRRVLAGLCPDCGYDRRASPGRCPECGAKSPVTSAP